jgi:hypothetical protein
MTPDKPMTAEAACALTDEIRTRLAEHTDDQLRASLRRYAEALITSADEAEQTEAFVSMSAQHAREIAGALLFASSFLSTPPTEGQTA